MEKKKDQKTKTKVYFCRATTLCSLVDVRSWIYKTKALSALPTCCNCLLTDGWEINGSSSKENALPVSQSKISGKMSTISKWRSGVCHIILLSISHVFIVSLVSILLYFCYFWHSTVHQFVPAFLSVHIHPTSQFPYQLISQINYYSSWS